MGSDGDDLVHKVLNAHDSLGTKLLLDDGVVGKGESLTSRLSVASFVNEIFDGLVGRISVSNVRFHSPEHVDGGLVKLNEDSVVELSESQQLHDLLALGVQLVDTKK